MSTGYTQELMTKPDMTFSEFAMLCARAFGALVDMRDEPLSARIPTTIKPSDYHKKAFHKAIGRKGRFMQLTPSQRKACANADILDKVRYHARSILEDIEKRRIYERMLAQVKAWQPPTSEHEGLKKFMIEQITSSIGHDCSESYHQESMMACAQKSTKNWVKERRRTFDNSIKYHRDEQKKEDSRCQDRTKWIQSLMTSLDIPISPESC